MTNYTVTSLRTEDVAWPDAEPIATDRVTAGAPEAATVVLEDTARHQLGLWRVTPGEFTTVHDGYVEYIHVLSGTAQLIDYNGAVTELSAGSTVLMQPGWKGLWSVSETLTKVFTVIYS